MNAFLWIWCFLEVNSYPIHEDILRRGSLNQSNQIRYQNKVRDFPLITKFNISKTTKEDELLQLKEDNMNTKIQIKSNVIEIKTQGVEVNKIGKINVNMVKSRLLKFFERLLVNQSELVNIKLLEAFKHPASKVINVYTQNQHINMKPLVHKYFNGIFNKSRIKREVPHMLLLTSMLNREDIINDSSTKPKIKRCKHKGRNMNTENKKRDAKVILLSNYNKKKQSKYNLLNANMFEKNINSKEKSPRANIVKFSPYFEPTRHVTLGQSKMQHNFVGKNDFQHQHQDLSPQANIDTKSLTLSDVGEAKGVMVESAQNFIPLENLINLNSSNLQELKKFDLNVTLNPDILYILNQQSRNFESDNLFLSDKDNLYERHISFDNTNSKSNEEEYYDNLSLEYSSQKDYTFGVLEETNFKKQNLTKIFSVPINVNDNNIINKNYTSIAIQKIFPPVSSFNTFKYSTNDHYSTKNFPLINENKSKENQLNIIDTQYNTPKTNLSFQHEIGYHIVPNINVINNYNVNSNQSQAKENSVNNIDNISSEFKTDPEHSNYSTIKNKATEDELHLKYNEYEEIGNTEKLIEKIDVSKSQNNSIGLIDFNVLINNITLLKDRALTGEPPVSDFTQQNKETITNRTTLLVQENESRYSNSNNGNKSELYSENKAQFKNELSIPIVITLDQNLHPSIQEIPTLEELNSSYDTSADIRNFQIQEQQQVSFQPNSINQLMNNKASQNLEHVSNSENEMKNNEFSDSNDSVYHQFKTYFDKQSIFFTTDGINDQNQENISDKIFALSKNLPTDKRNYNSKPTTFISVPWKNYNSGNKRLVLLPVDTYSEKHEKNIQHDTERKISMLQGTKPENIPQRILVNDTQNIIPSNGHQLEFIKNSDKLKSRILYHQNNLETIRDTIDINHNGKGEPHPTSNSNDPMYEIKGTMKLHISNPITSKHVMFDVPYSNKEINHIQRNSHSEEIDYRFQESAEHSTLQSLLEKYETILNIQNSTLHFPQVNISNQESQHTQAKNFINGNVAETDTIYIQNGEDDYSPKPHDTHNPCPTLTKYSHNPDGYRNLKLDISHNFAKNENNQSPLLKYLKNFTSISENHNSKLGDHYLQMGAVPFTNSSYLSFNIINNTFNGSELLTDPHQAKHNIVGHISSNINQRQHLAYANSNTGSLLVTNENDTKNNSSFEHVPEERTYKLDKNCYNIDINIPNYNDDEKGTTINDNYNEKKRSVNVLKKSLNNTHNFYDNLCAHVTKNEDQIKKIRDDKLATLLDVLTANIGTKIHNDNTEKTKRYSVKTDTNLIANTFSTPKPYSNLHSKLNLKYKIPSEDFPNKYVYNETKNKHTAGNLQNFTSVYRDKQINNSERGVIQNHENENRLSKHSALNMKNQSEFYGKDKESVGSNNEREMESSTSHAKIETISMTSYRENKSSEPSLENNITNFFKDEKLLQTINDSSIVISNKTKSNFQNDDNYKKNIFYDEQMKFLNYQLNDTHNNKEHTDSNATIFKLTHLPYIKPSSENLQISGHNYAAIHNENKTIAKTESLNTVHKATSANRPIFTVSKESKSGPEEQMNTPVNYVQNNYNDCNIRSTDNCNKSQITTEKYSKQQLNTSNILEDDILKSNFIKSYILNSNNFKSSVNQPPLIHKNINSIHNILPFNNNKSIPENNTPHQFLLDTNFSKGSFNNFSSFKENYNATEIMNNVHQIKTNAANLLESTTTSSSFKINPYESEVYSSEDGRSVFEYEISTVKNDHRKLCDQNETSTIETSVGENYEHHKYKSIERLLFHENVPVESKIFYNNTLIYKENGTSLESILLTPKTRNNKFSVINSSNNDKPTYPSHIWNKNKNIFINSLVHHSNQTSKEMKSSREENYDQQTLKNILSDINIYNMTSIREIKNPEIRSDTSNEMNFTDIEGEILNYASGKEQNVFNDISSINKSENNYLDTDFYIQNYYNSFPSLKETEESQSISQSLKSISDKFSLVINEKKNKYSSSEDAAFSSNNTISDRNNNSFISLGDTLHQNNTPNFYRVPSMDLNWMKTLNNSNFFKLNPTEPNYKHQREMWGILPDENDEEDIEEIKYYRNENNKQNKYLPQLNDSFKTDKSDETNISGNITGHNNCSLLLGSFSDNIPIINNETLGSVHEVLNNITLRNKFDERPQSDFVDQLTDISIRNKNIPTNNTPQNYQIHFTDKSISKEAGMVSNIHEKRNINHNFSQLRSDNNLIYNSENTMKDFKLVNSVNMMSMPANGIRVNNENNIIQSSQFYDIGNDQKTTDEFTKFQENDDQLQTTFAYNKSSPITFIGDLYMISKTVPKNSNETHSGRNEVENNLILLNHDFQIPLLIKMNTNFTDAESLQPLRPAKNKDIPDDKIGHRINSEFDNDNKTEKIKDILHIKAIINAKIQNPTQERSENKYFQNTVQSKENHSSQFGKDFLNSHAIGQINNKTHNGRNNIENLHVKPIQKTQYFDVKHNEQISNEIQESLSTSNINLSSNNKYGTLITHSEETRLHNPKRNSIQITNPPQNYLNKVNYKHNKWNSKSKSKYEIIKDIIVWYHDKNKDMLNKDD